MTTVNPSIPEVIAAFRAVYIENQKPAPKKKSVRAWIQAHKGVALIDSLLKKYGAERVAPILLHIVKTGELDTTPDRTPQSPSQEKPSTNEKDGQADPVQDGEGSQPKLQELKPMASKMAASTESEPRSSIDRTETISPLHPPTDKNLHSPAPQIELDLGCQHELFTSLQRILEASVHQFAISTFKAVLGNREWGCGQCVELNDWMKILRRHENQLIQKKSQPLKKPFPRLLNSMTQIRHNAVHRKHIPAGQIITYIEDAESLLELLGDEPGLEQVKELKQCTTKIMSELKQHKHNAEVQLLNIERDTEANEAALRVTRAHHTRRVEAEYHTVAEAANVELRRIFAPYQLPDFTSSATGPCELTCAEHTDEPSLRICQQCVREQHINPTHSTTNNREIDQVTPLNHQHTTIVICALFIFMTVGCQVLLLYWIK